MMYDFRGFCKICGTIRGTINNAVKRRSISKEEGEEEDDYGNMDFDDEGDNEFDGSL